MRGTLRPGKRAEGGKKPFEERKGDLPWKNKRSVPIEEAPT